MAPPRTCACCRRPAWAGPGGRARSRFCWHPDCACLAYCDACELARTLPGSPVCGPCALRLARDPRRRARPAPVAAAKKYGQGTVERKGRRYRARVGGGGRGRYLTLGYYATEWEAVAAIAAYRRDGGGQRRAA